MRKLLVLLAACRGPSADVRTPTPSREVLALRCEGDPELGATHELGMEAGTITLHPRTTGPRIRDRARSGPTRAWPQLDDALAQAQPVLHDCWTWASSRGAPEVIADVSFTVAPFGQLKDFSIVTTKGRAPELVACLQDTLVNLSIDRLSPRTTRMHTRIEFVRTDKDPWLVMPLHPNKPTPERRARQCMPVLEDVVDVLDSPVLYRIDDADASHKARLSPITVTIGCPQGGGISTGSRDIAKAFAANLGSFEGCYAQTTERGVAEAVRTQHRHEPIAGTVELSVTLEGPAQPRDIVIAGAGDGEFHECLRDATNELWLDPGSDIAIRAHVTFQLDPQVPDEPIDIKTLEQSVADSHGEMDRCHALSWLLEALAKQRPWLDDPKLLATAHALAESAAKLPYSDSCLRQVESVLRDIAFAPAHDDFRWSSLKRIEAVLPLANHGSWGPPIRWKYAATIAMTRARNAEGVAFLRALARTDDRVNDLAEQHLAQYQPPHPVRAKPCL